MLLLRLAGVRALGNQRLRGPFVSLPDITHRSLPFAYISHAGSGGTETAPHLLRWLGAAGWFRGQLVQSQEGCVCACPGTSWQRGRRRGQE